MTFRGKKGYNFHIVTAYRPQSNNNPYGVYQQLLHYNNDHSINEDPIHTYDKQLASYLSQFITRGDQVLLMIDANENLSSQTKNSFVHSMAQIGLYESILSRHPGLSTPATRTPGGHPIDSIFCSPSVVINKSGYAPFNGFTDHRLSWVDIEWGSVFCHNITIPKPQVRRLKTDLPQVVEKYIANLQNLLYQHDIYTKIDVLNKAIHTTMTSAQTTTFEDIDAVITECMLSAERSCRKLRMGGVQYSPTLALYLNTINFWRLILRKQRGHNINMRTIIRLQKRCRIFGKPL